MIHDKSLNSADNQRPIITFFLYCYNQEPFIAQALQGAFDQTYSPLEIVVSDDCSTDRTFDIVRHMVETYRGHHIVRINRNAVNLGMGANVSRSQELCSGALIIQADGDDESLPHRTEAIYRAWERSDRRATSIFSSYISMATDGRELGVGGRRLGVPRDATSVRLDGSIHEFLATRQPVVSGCANAWSPELFSYFGDLGTDLGDSLLSFRSLAIGQIVYVDEPLVKYRRHDGNVSFFERREQLSLERRERRLRWVANQSVKLFEAILADIGTLYRRGAIAEAERDRWSTTATMMLRRYALGKEMMDGSLLGRLDTVLRTIAKGEVRAAVRCLPRLLPRRLYAVLYRLRESYKDLTGSAPARL